MGATSSSSTPREERDEEPKADAEKLQNQITDFYDGSTGIFEVIFGEHLHDGYYEPGSTLSLSGHPSAQIRMIEEILRFASISDDPLKKPKSIIDVGCGVGGTSRYLARKYGAQCKGITISPWEAQRAQAQAAAEGLESKVSFEVGDAVAQPFPDGQFDLVWCLQTAEHIPEKEKLLREMVRVASPGGTVVLVTWCHRDLSPSEESLKPEEMKLLKKICDVLSAAPWCSKTYYVDVLKSLPLEDVKVEDWSEYAAPSWSILQSAFTWKTIMSLILKGSSGWEALKFVRILPVMIKGYEKGILKHAVITCRKSE